MFNLDNPYANTKLKAAFNLLLNRGYNKDDIINYINSNGYTNYDTPDDMSGIPSIHPLIDYANTRQNLQTTFDFSPIYNRNLVDDLENVQQYALEENGSGWAGIPWTKPSSEHNLITKYGYDPYLLRKGLYGDDWDMEHGQAISSEASGGIFGKPASVPEFSMGSSAKQSAETLMNLTPNQIFRMDPLNNMQYNDDYLLYLIRDLAKGGNI